MTTKAAWNYAFTQGHTAEDSDSFAEWVKFYEDSNLSESYDRWLTAEGQDRGERAANTQ